MAPPLSTKRPFSFILFTHLSYGKADYIDRLDGNKIISSQHTLFSIEHRISMYRDNIYNYVCNDERRLSALCVYIYIVAGGELAY